MKQIMFFSVVSMATVLLGCSDLHTPESHQALPPSDGLVGTGVEPLEYLAETYAKQAVVNRVGFDVSDVGPKYSSHRMPFKPAKAVKTALFCFDGVSTSEGSAIGVRLTFENSKATVIADLKTKRLDARESPDFEVDAFFTTSGICGAVKLNNVDVLKETSFYPAIGLSSTFPGFRASAAGEASVSQYVIVALPE